MQVKNWTIRAKGNLNKSTFTTLGDYSDHEIKFLNTALQPYLLRLKDVANNLELIELGSGYGRVIEGVFLKYGFKYVTALDICQDALDMLKKNVNPNDDPSKPSVRVISGVNTNALPTVPPSTQGDGYHLIFCNWTLEYLDDEDCLPLMKNAYDKLHKDGLLIIKMTMNSNN